MRMTADLDPTQRKQARRGFSLAELVVVIVIIATLASVAAPRFASADSSFRVSGAAEQLADAIRDAAAEARRRSTTVVIRISVASDNFNAAVQSPLEYLRIYNTSDDPFKADIRATEAADGGTKIFVNGFGVYSTSATIRISVGAQERAIMIDSVSGTVTVGSVDEALAFRASERYR